MSAEGTPRVKGIVLTQWIVSSSPVDWSHTRPASGSGERPDRQLGCLGGDRAGGGAAERESAPAVPPEQRDASGSGQVRDGAHRLGVLAVGAAEDGLGPAVDRSVGRIGGETRRPQNHGGRRAALTDGLGG